MAKFGCGLAVLAIAIVIVIACVQCVMLQVGVVGEDTTSVMERLKADILAGKAWVIGEHEVAAAPDENGQLVVVVRKDKLFHMEVMEKDQKKVFTSSKDTKFLEFSVEPSRGPRPYKLVVKSR